MTELDGPRAATLKITSEMRSLLPGIRDYPAQEREGKPLVRPNGKGAGGVVAQITGTHGAYESVDRISLLQSEVPFVHILYDAI